MTRTLRALLLLAFGLAFVLIWWTGVLDSLSLTQVQARLGEIRAYVELQPIAAWAGFFLLYVTVTALSLPGAAMLTLLAGAVFGFWAGLVLASFASTLGATLAFTLARLVARDWAKSRFSRFYQDIEMRWQRDGDLALLSLRLIPVIPFFAINLLMGLLPISALRFAVISQIGMFPGTAAYVNAGLELAKIRSLDGLLEPRLLFAFGILAALPWLARSAFLKWRVWSKFRRFKRPRKFDFDLIVIGGGSAGLVSAYIGSAVKAKVALIERERMGGDCLNTGCVPSKAIIQAGRVARTVRDASRFGIEAKTEQVHFEAVMERVRRVIQTIEPHDSVERYSGLGVHCVRGDARLISPWQVQVGDQVLSARNVILATGARPRLPKIENINLVKWYTSDTIWSLREKPQALMVVGGGPIGCELAQTFAHLGVSVTLVERGEALLPREDHDVQQLLRRCLEESGVRVCLGSELVEVRKDEILVRNRTTQSDTWQQTDAVLFAIGREPRTEGLGLDEIGIELERDSRIRVDQTMRTNHPHVFACGDVAGPFQLTHAASHQAWYCAVNALFAPFYQPKIGYENLPWVTYTIPEVARVGLSEREASESGVEFEVTSFPLSRLDRAIAEGETEGFVKILTAKGADRILGASVVALHAGEMMAEIVLAKKSGLGLNRILGTIHSYPTWSEANKLAAGQWRREHKPERLMRWLEAYFAWCRG
jgi:pyruvate/2-oxoglutarate dehydrogenase complex dihydrolipoamide dehydrogenase (E3) component/uncharacterized membrane protein YdjX (TVP38/TMEM64 family)